MTYFESSWTGITQREKFKDRWCTLLFIYLFIIYLLFCNLSGASLSLPFPFFSVVSLKFSLWWCFLTDLTALMITNTFAFLFFFGFPFLLFSSLPFSASFSVTDAAKLGRTRPEFRAQLCRPWATKFLLFFLAPEQSLLAFMVCAGRAENCWILQKHFCAKFCIFGEPQLNG